ncbi:MAG TPA: GNAT family N-acetyltransferase [Solirubrobacteraceae bacterium]|jgi:GNAT superfamily N-acetyltransferase|nr:GNAT family N-acetyltransferase [Solirubrobacteraceae bacterium]
MAESQPSRVDDTQAHPPGDLGMRPAAVEDVARLKTVLAEAFYDDPVFSWLMPEDSKRHAHLRRYFGIDLGHFALPHGRVWTTDDLMGAALTLPPGKWRVPPRTTLLHGSAFGVRLPRAARMGATMEWRHARELRGPHYYVRDIGVHPDMQGRGLGSALMRPTLDRCDREGMRAYIEASSERSAVLYERLGFRHVKELRVGASPPLWLMIRPPKHTQAAS